MIAAIYARKSTEQNGVAVEEKSVARQIAHAQAYAARKSWLVDEDHVYVDDGISGAEFVKRRSSSGSAGSRAWTSDTSRALCENGSAM